MPPFYAGRSSALPSLHMLPVGNLDISRNIEAPDEPLAGFEEAAAFAAAHVAAAANNASNAAANNASNAAAHNANNAAANNAAAALQASVQTLVGFEHATSLAWAHVADAANNASNAAAATGVRYKKALDGSLIEYTTIIKADDKDNAENSILLKDFLEAVQKHTMGETGKTSEIFTSHEQVVAVNDIAPRSVPLGSNVGPFRNQNRLVVAGKSAASAYCNLTLKCIYEYIDKGSIFKPINKFCLMHGGLPLDANGKAIFERCIPNAMQSIMSGKEIKATDVSPFAKFNDIHQLGFGGSVITGRLAVEEACTGTDKALNAMHPLMRTTVVGHTPQWIGIPTIIRETPIDAKFLVALDTQFSDRQKNTHSLGLFEDGSFCLVGKWMDALEYSARSDDIHIGQKITIQSSEMTSHEHETPFFRVIAKVKGQASPVYIAVNYALNKKNVFGPGFTTVCLVSFSRKSDMEPFEAKVVQPDMEIVRVTKKTFLTTGVVTLNGYYHARLPGIDNGMESSKMTDNPNTQTGIANRFRTFVCGDIEASVDFLHAFILHSYKMATNQTFDPMYLSIMNDKWERGVHDIQQYGLPYDGSLGFDAKSISNKMKEIMYLSGDLSETVDESGESGIATFSCIGDVIGDPVGKGNLDQVSGTEQIHEFMCVHWANTFCENNVVGNRDINKLRFLQEIPYIFKPSHMPYLQMLSQYQQEVASGDETNIVKLKRLLGHFCYPYVPSGTAKDELGNPINVNKSFARDAAIVPFRATAQDPSPYPQTVWD